MVNSVKSNFIYNLINTISGLLFPMIVFPYASRVILADGIGQVQFYTSIIQYVVMFSSIGIPLYGVREIARVRDNKGLLVNTTTELVVLNLILNIFGYIAIAIMCNTIAKIQVNLPLFLLLSSSVLLTTLGCEWFYKGIEDFKYIALRGLGIKILCLIMLFVFVKSQDDLLYYGAYTVLGSIGNNILNFIRLRKFVHVREIDWSSFRPLRHLRPAFSVFIFNIVTSIYLNLDSVMLGMLSSVESVGFYTAATKLSHILVTLVTTLGAVMLPRLSNLIENHNTDGFYKLANQSYRFILMMAFPICAGLIVMAPSLIRIFCGELFEPAIYTLQIMAPIIIAIGVSNFIGIQVLYPLGKIKLVIISTGVGAAINFILNIILIPILAQNGAAIATLFAEISVTVTQIIIARQYLPVKIFNIYFWRYLLISIIVFFICYTMKILGWSDLTNVFSISIIGFILYTLGLLIFKDDMFCDYVAKLKCKLKS